MEFVNCVLCGKDNSDILYKRGLFKRGEKPVKFNNVICRDCGLVYVNPRMAAKEAAGFSEEKYVENRFSLDTKEKIEKHIKHLEEKNSYNANVDFLKKYVKPGHKVLEIGSAFGLMLRGLRGATGCEVLGVEPAESAIYAKEKYGLPIFHGTFDDFSKSYAEKEEKFDVVMMHHVFEHFADPLEILKKIKFLLKPEGLLYIEVPNVLLFEREAENFFDFWHYFNYSPGTLSKMLEREGFYITARNGAKPARIQIIASQNPDGCVRELAKENSYEEIKNYIEQKTFIDSIIKLARFFKKVFIKINKFLFMDTQSDKKIKVGIIGVGNCFAGLIQGIEYYKNNPEKQVIGLMHQKMGGYDFSDIEFVSAFDVAANKIGKALNEAVYAEPNLVNWVKLPSGGPTVSEAPVSDGIGIYVANKVIPLTNPAPEAELRPKILEEIRRTGTEILINYLPVGSQKATEFWADVALESGCAFINCIPAFIASAPEWENKFKEKNIPIIGDDIKGQVGATIVHRVLTRLCNDRGTKIKKTYQLNVGGNTDFLNMKEQGRLLSKKVSKTEAVTSQIDEGIAADNVYVGPSDFIPFLGNTKLCFIRIEGNMFADIPFNMELRLEVDDKANSAGVVIDCIRCAKIALERKIGGYIDVSSYFMKHPLVQVPDSEAKNKVEKFINQLL